MCRACRDMSAASPHHCAPLPKHLCCHPVMSPWEEGPGCLRGGSEAVPALVVPVDPSQQVSTSLCLHGRVSSSVSDQQHWAV